MDVEHDTLLYMTRVSDRGTGRAPDDVVALAPLCALSIDSTMRLTAYSLDVLSALLSSRQYYCRVDVTHIHVACTSIGGRAVS